MRRDITVGKSSVQASNRLLAWVLFCLIYQTYPFDNLTARPHNLEELRALFDECHPGGWLAGVLGGLDDVFHDRISKLQYLIHGITLLSDAGNVPPVQEEGRSTLCCSFSSTT
ncbi:hypothetical protein Krac_4816 [Ktedonobacter racemifer DSM 44963]|uniref:Uncharacterized protein n=1 Tax=Ktedonobacter racemifer DSM 44963 TaxID=485913 RepID=D6TTR8_KTERA|nr:hypothetical protein Krac_4816 [Ktedonobacter racemifer DSM 44963]